MSLLAVGLNYRNTPLALREQAVISREALPEALRSLKDSTGVQEAVILSTCNRTDIYCASYEPVTGGIGTWLCNYHGHGDKLRQYLYQHPDREAVRHVMRVASGLDSMVPGEPQVLGQLKDAWRDASDAGTMGQMLDRLLQHSFATAKEVRSNTDIGNSPVSIATIGVRLAKQIFSSLRQSTAMLIGAGEMIEITARHLHQAETGKLIIANRSLNKAQQLASRYHGFATDFSSMPKHLAEADIIISCTARQGYILSQQTLKAALAKRLHRPMFLIDLAVPRDIDPDIANCSDAYLYNIDDLREVSERNLGNRRDAINQAEMIVNDRVSDFMSWLNGRAHADTIKSLHEESWRTREQLMENARHDLDRGHDPAAVLDKVTRELTGKLLHQATTSIRQDKEQDNSRTRSPRRKD